MVATRPDHSILCFIWPEVTYLVGRTSRGTIGSMTTPSRWQKITAANPDHSQWYIDRFERMRAAGIDLAGEARTCDALVERGARIIDAGCGPGRVAVLLAESGHSVIGLDIDPQLLAAAQVLAERSDHANLDVEFIEADICQPWPAGEADLIVCCGNVLTFLDGDQPRTALTHMRAALAPQGRIVTGFGLERGYSAAQFDADCAAAGLTVEARFSTWQLAPYTAQSTYLVAFLAPA